MNVIGISVGIAVPAGLHADLVGIKNCEVLLSQRSVTPETRSVTVRSLFQLIVGADVYFILSAYVSQFVS